MAVIYGVNPVLEQLAAEPKRIEHLYLPRGPLRGRLGRVVRLARERGVAVTFLERKALDRLAGAGEHQGAVAEVGEYDYATLDEILKELGGQERPKAPARVVVLDGVQDPRNLGSVVRSAVGAGADGVVIPQRRAAGMTAAAVRASAGAAAAARVARVTNLARALERFKGAGLWCVAVEAGGEKDVRALDPGLDYALVFGGEGKGARRLVRERCDLTARIPMRGPLDSLNVSVAVGVTLFALLP